MPPKILRASLVLTLTAALFGWSPAALAAWSTDGRNTGRSTVVATAAPARTASTAGAPAGASDHDAQYAARQARAPQAAKFKGGESVGIYIGGSTVAIILLVVLLVILL